MVKDTVLTREKRQSIRRVHEPGGWWQLIQWSGPQQQLFLEGRGSPLLQLVARVGDLEGNTTQDMILKMETLQTFELMFGFSFGLALALGLALPLRFAVAFQALTRDDAATLFAGISSRTVYA